MHSGNNIFFVQNSRLTRTAQRGIIQIRDMSVLRAAHREKQVLKMFPRKGPGTALPNKTALYCLK